MEIPFSDRMIVVGINDRERYDKFRWLVEKHGSDLFVFPELFQELTCQVTHSICLDRHSMLVNYNRRCGGKRIYCNWIDGGFCLLSTIADKDIKDYYLLDHPFDFLQDVDYYLALDFDGRILVDSLEKYGKCACDALFDKDEREQAYLDLYEALREAQPLAVEVSTAVEDMVF